MMALNNSIPLIFLGAHFIQTRRKNKYGITAALSETRAIKLNTIYPSLLGSGFTYALRMYPR